MKEGGWGGVELEENKTHLQKNFNVFPIFYPEVISNSMTPTRI